MTFVLLLPQPPLAGSWLLCIIMSFDVFVNAHQKIRPSADFNFCIISLISVKFLFYNNVILATLSPSSLNLIILTPWVARPRVETVFNGVRITWPLTEIAIKSHSSVLLITDILIIFPVFGVTDMVLIPDPPLP